MVMDLGFSTVIRTFSSSPRPYNYNMCGTDINIYMYNVYTCIGTLRKNAIIVLVLVDARPSNH